jgi:hypothetical protein
LDAIAWAIALTFVVVSTASIALIAWVVIIEWVKSLIRHDREVE